MRKPNTSINYEWLTRPTGDQFADAGGFAIEYLLNRPDEINKERDILRLIKEVANIYIKRWVAGLHMFFLNSTITQSAKGFQTHDEKLLKTETYFKSIINETSYFNEGTCRITGEKTKLFKAGRENSILTGSGTFLNFHHAMEAGVMLSKEAIIRFFFVPIASIMVYDKMSIIHSNQNELVKHFIFKNVSENIKIHYSNLL
jgi:CRISPR-associated protein Cst1